MMRVRAELKGHSLTISGLEVLEDMGIAVSGSRDYAVQVWDLESQGPIRSSKISRNVVTWVRRAPGEPVVMQASEDLRLRLWDVRTMECTVTLEGHTNIPHCCDVSEDGNYLLSSSNGFDGTGCEVRVWDRRQGTLLHEMNAHTMSTNACCFIPKTGAPPGEGAASIPLKALSVSTDRSVRPWNAQAGTCEDDSSFYAENESDLGPVMCCTWLESGGAPRFVAAGDYSGRVQIWSMSNAKLHTTGYTPDA